MLFKIFVALLCISESYVIKRKMQLEVKSTNYMKKNNDKI